MKKLFTFIIGCMTAFTAMAQTSGSSVSNAWGLNGSGTEADPYRISTAADFTTMATHCTADNKGTGEYFAMTNDIDFGGSEENPVQLPAIGKDGNAKIAEIAYGFDGTFDGHDFKITGIYHTNSGNNADGKYNGLFGCIDKNGVVKNINIDIDNHIESYNYVGAIASLNMGVIENCSNSADIVATNFAAGGICGFMVNGTGTIRNCQNYGDVKAMTYASGICGGSQSGKTITDYAYLIDNCHNYGDVSTTNGLGSAGVAGSWSGAIKNSSNQGIIDDTKGTAKSKQYTAGIVSCVSYAADIEGCTNWSAVNGVKNVGGIVGNVMKADDAETVVRNCFNKGAVSGEDLYVSGIVANSARTAGKVSVAHCTNMGTVTSTGTTEFIGNFRGNTTIAHGEGNELGEGLPVLNLDEIVTGINSTENTVNGTADGAYLVNGKVVIVKNNKRYNVSGTRL